jgi:ABC-type antimicrobial peptide transport system permease subunit
MARTAQTALRALRRNPMRATLTTLGIVIGVGAVIAMMEIGAGSSSQIQKGLSSMGANVLLVMPTTTTNAGVNSGSVITLTPQDCEAIIRECPAVRAAAPVVRSRTQLVYGSRNWQPDSLWGTTAAFLDVRQCELQEGELFGNRDILNSNRVCVIGKTIVRELFDGQSPLGKEVRVKNVNFRVIGVLKSKGANMMGMDQDDIVLAPWSTIKSRVTGSTLQSSSQSVSSSSSSSNSVNTLSNLYPSGQTSLYPEQSEVQAADYPMPVRFTNVDQILVTARNAKSIKPAIKQITEVLRRRHHLKPSQADDFNIRDMTEMHNMLTSTTSLMSNLLLCVATISLVVGGVGIMNIMLVSVTERTREIGLRMAVGAHPNDILRQFLVESVVLSLLGGTIGILLGRSISFLVKLLLNWPTELSIPAIVAAVAVSASVGIIFGYYPAWKASQLDPIEALRYE